MIFYPRCPSAAIFTLDIFVHNCSYTSSLFANIHSEVSSFNSHPLFNMANYVSNISTGIIDVPSTRFSGVANRDNLMVDGPSLSGFGVTQDHTIVCSHPLHQLLNLSWCCCSDPTDAKFEVAKYVNDLNGKSDSHYIPKQFVFLIMVHEFTQFTHPS